MNLVTILNPNLPFPCNDIIACFYYFLCMLAKIVLANLISLFVTHVIAGLRNCWYIQFVPKFLKLSCFLIKG